MTKLTAHSTILSIPIDRHCDAPSLLSNEGAIVSRLVRQLAISAVLALSLSLAIFPFKCRVICGMKVTEFEFFSSTLCPVGN